MFKTSWTTWCLLVLGSFFPPFLLLRLYALWISGQCQKDTHTYFITILYKFIYNINIFVHLHVEATLGNAMQMIYTCKYIYVCSFKYSRHLSLSLSPPLSKHASSAFGSKHANLLGSSEVVASWERPALWPTKFWACRLHSNRCSTIGPDRRPSQPDGGQTRRKAILKSWVCSTWWSLWR